jgi:glycosyltransferase involved in cell wall biosynthesis
MPEISGLVSIIIPFYNRESLLRDAIESVLAQTYSHWELFLVDDGSTDGSAELARDYASRKPENVHYLDHPNHTNCGVTRTRNLGAAASQGEYLAFLDSDDIWLPNKLEYQVAIMQAFPQVGLCCSPSEYWYSWDPDAGPDAEDHVPALAPAEKLYDPPFLFVNSYPIGDYGAPTPASFLVRRTAFDLVGGFAEEFNPATDPLYEDIAFVSKFYLEVPVYIAGLCTDRYRFRSDSLWVRALGTNRDEQGRRFYFRWLRHYLHSRAINDRSVWKAVRRKGYLYFLPLPASFTKLIRRIENRLFR